MAGAGAAELMAAFGGGGAIENDAYAKQALRIAQAQSVQAQRDQRIQEAYREARVNKAQEGFPNAFAAAITNMDPDQTTFGPNQIAAILPEVFAATGYDSSAMGGFDKILQSLSRVAMERGAKDAGLTPMNQAAQVFNMDTVPTIEEVGDLMVRGNLTANPEVDQVLSALNTASNAKAGAPGVREQKIQDMMDLYQMDRGTAVAFVDGIVSQDVNDATGNIIRHNPLPEGTINIPGYQGAATEIPLTGGTAGTPPPAPQPGQTLYELASYATGLQNSMTDLIARGTSLFGLDPDMTSTRAIQTINTATNEMIRSLSINPRFPVGEIERLRQEIKMKPGWLTSPTVMQSRMDSVRQSLELRVQQAERDAADPTISEDIRQSQSDNAVAIRNFLPQLGGPKPQMPPDQFRQAQEVARTKYPGFDELSPSDQLAIIEADMAEGR